MTTFLEPLTIRVGAAVAKSVLKLWLGKTGAPADLSGSVVDSLQGIIPGLLERRRVDRQFSRLAEEVASRLAPFFDTEMPSLSDNEKLAAIQAVAQTIDVGTISIYEIVAADMQPERLLHRLRELDPTAAQDNLLNQQATAVYDYTLREACNYIVEAATSLPNFTTQVSRQLLERETQILDLLVKAIDRLPQRSAAEEGDDGFRTSSFETQYRRDIARKFDWMELHGASLPGQTARYALTAAYVTLGLSEQSTDTAAGGGNRERTRPLERVDEVLSQGKRFLIRGDAGSGKTTLLRWLAIRGARRSFPPTLNPWNELTPFLLPLRLYSDNAFPSPSAFPEAVSPLSMDIMPPNWVHSRLADGHGLVLVDGLDELREVSRERALAWFTDLVATFPEATYVVSSRTLAATGKWLELPNFVVADLLPMSVPDIEALIHHWHRTVLDSSTNGPEPEELQRLEEQLVGVVRDNVAIRLLASSPLLCAFLCGLNLERRARLPEHRMELYRIAIEMLLHRRDAERSAAAGVSLGLDLGLSFQERHVLVQDLAYWLFLNGSLDVARSEAAERIGLRCTSMPNVKDPVANVCEFLFERSGLLREPVDGRLEFTHRTFQEYLAAKEAVDQGNIGQLVQSAHNDDWHGTVVLAAGHANVRQRGELLNGLLRRADQDSAQRNGLELLAVSCLETCPTLPPELVESITSRVSRIVPPKDYAEASALAAAGDVAVGAITRLPLSTLNPAAAAACVRTLTEVGSESAMSALRMFALDSRTQIVREVLRAWGGFEPTEFATKVLRESSLDGGVVVVNSVRHAMAARSLLQLRRVECVLTGIRGDLDELRQVPKLVRLKIDDASDLRTLKALEVHSKLEALSLHQCQRLWNVDALMSLFHLVSLELAGIEELTYLGALPLVHGLGTLTLRSARCTIDVQSLMHMRGLVRLDLSGSERIPPLGPMKLVTTLSVLNLSRTNVEDVAAIGDISSLTEIDLSYTRVRNITPLLRLSRLQRVNLTGCSVARQDVEALRARAHVVGVGPEGLHYSDEAGRP